GVVALNSEHRASNHDLAVRLESRAIGVEARCGIDDDSAVAKSGIGGAVLEQASEEEMRMTVYRDGSDSYEIAVRLAQDLREPSARTVGNSHNGNPVAGKRIVE